MVRGTSRPKFCPPSGSYLAEPRESPGGRLMDSVIVEVFCIFPHLSADFRHPH